ncbi:hypothetical protein C5167_044447 [Papaver somniferum]|uniref:Uncharacterized protein n=1 Tax=Papaver somniferum TaxID=3469 RepID=A0A4Y7LBF9_PAPSO|nr:hypothetical protein C5167_044447 [Papaver somniferum]
MEEEIDYIQIWFQDEKTKKMRRNGFCDGHLYTRFNLEPNKTANKVVKALKVWKFENKRRGKVWSLELHLMEQSVSIFCPLTNNWLSDSFLGLHLQERFSISWL